MWLALDVGNSALKGGVYEGDVLRHTFRLETGGGRSWREALGAEVDEVRPARVGVASVVPAATAALREVLAAERGLPLLVVGPALRLPFRMDYGTPETLGTDRLAAAAAAWTRYGTPDRPVVALDAGTAVTYEVIADGAYLGGAIGPGPGLLRRALHHGTAQLPDVPPAYPVDVVGRSTRAAIQSGTMHGFVDGVRGMLRRLADVLPARPHVVATGGWGPLLAEHVAGIDAVEPHLVLEGVHALMRLNPAGER